MELKIQTDVGELIAVFDINSQGVVAWFEGPYHIIVQAEDVHQAIEELLISLDAVLNYEISQLLK